jgi:hypothetical protein
MQSLIIKIHTSLSVNYLKILNIGFIQYSLSTHRNESPPFYVPNIKLLFSLYKKTATHISSLCVAVWIIIQLLLSLKYCILIFFHSFVLNSMTYSCKPVRSAISCAITLQSLRV